MTTTITKKDACGKCGGTGNLPYYRHVASGVCFACNGKGDIKIKIETTQEEIAKVKKQEAWILNVTPERFRALPIEKMAKIDKAMCASWALMSDEAYDRYMRDLLGLYHHKKMLGR